MYAQLLVTYIIGSLLFAWCLSWFDVDKIIINGINEIFNLRVTDSGYYVLFVIVGIAVSIIDFIKK